MEQDLSTGQMSRGEKETETEAARLIEHIEEALAAVATRSTVDVESLEAVADRIERAARDLSTALRELAEQRRLDQNVVE
jgi:cell division FtsZ-interacting protein ZapD